MSKQFDYQKIDVYLHSRIRLSIMALLSTVDEIDFTTLCKEVNATKGNVSVHLKKLEALGFLKRNPSKPRAISVISTHNQEPEMDLSKNNLVFVPVLGNIAAGKPILAEENIQDYFPLTPDFVKGQNEVFMLNVRGDSMVNAGIMDRDLVVVRKQETAINGEIIVALLEEEATVKRFFKGKTEIKLMPENDYMEPMIVSDVTILGNMTDKYY